VCRVRSEVIWGDISAIVDAQNGGLSGGIGGDLRNSPVAEKLGAIDCQSHRAHKNYAHRDHYQEDGLSLLVFSSHGEYLKHNNSLRGRCDVYVQRQGDPRIVWILDIDLHQRARLVVGRIYNIHDESGSVEHSHAGELFDLGNHGSLIARSARWVACSGSVAAMDDGIP